MRKPQIEEIIENAEITIATPADVQVELHTEYSGMT
jgi:hypothetical protein